MKKFIPITIVILLMIGIVVGLILFKDKEEEESAGGDSDVRDTISLVGTGTNYNDGIVASSTISTEVLQTIYSFASSSDETYWDTVNEWPNKYGATTSPRFLNRKADLITINGVFKGVQALSSFTFKVSGSNDPTCNSASSTLNYGVNWYPIPTPQATSTLESSIMYDGNAITISPGDTASTSFAFNIEDINYDCTKIDFYNGSTTDESLLYVEATFKKKN